MKALKNLFEEIMKTPLGVKFCDSEKIVATVDKNMEVTVVREINFDEGGMIRVFVNDALVYGYGYESLTLDQRKQIHTWFGVVRGIHHANQDQISKISQMWFLERYDC